MGQVPGQWSLVILLVAAVEGQEKMTTTQVYHHYHYHQSQRPYFNNDTGIVIIVETCSIVTMTQVLSLMNFARCDGDNTDECLPSSIKTSCLC